MVLLTCWEKNKNTVGVALSRLDHPYECLCGYDWFGTCGGLLEAVLFFSLAKFASC